MLHFKRFCSSFQRLKSVSNTKKPGDQIGVKGWVKNIRRLKNNFFIDINDGSTDQKFQIVVPKTDQNRAIAPGSTIEANGRLQLAPNGQFELHAEEISVIANGHIAEGFPFAPKQQHPPEYVREHLHLRSRVDYIASQMRLRHKATKAIHDFMDDHDFVHINTPIITTNDCEGAGEVFAVKPDSDKLLQNMKRHGIPEEQSYFDAKVFLSVSGQLHLEAMSYGLGNTYTLSPAFRAENSKSPLHLAEFYMLEAELAFIDELPQLASFIEKMLKQVTKTILSTSSEDLNKCQKSANCDSHTLRWLDAQWTSLSYDEAAQLITANNEKFKAKFVLGEDFSKEQELFIVAHCGTPVFVVDWPLQQKPFYMKVSRSNAQRVHALDLLMPTVGELCGGSLREPDVHILQQHPDFPKDLDWYLELRKFGGVPTGGFGIGFERYLQLLTGVKNIRDVIPFPRYPHSCKICHHDPFTTLFKQSSDGCNAIQTSNNSTTE